MSDKAASEGRESPSSSPFTGTLTAVNAANAIRSARLTARELLDTAELLFSLKRFPHSMALSILAIEEASKVGILLGMFIEAGENDANKSWKSYRRHRAKTAWLNPAIESRVRATFPHVPREEAKRLAAAGPTPEQLEISKQRAIYSDCLEIAGQFVAHCPGVAEWRQDAWERLCEAQAMISGLRDYPPEELEIWRKHAAQAVAEGKSLLATLPELHNELQEKGFIKPGWWDTLLKDAEAEEREREPGGC